MLSVSRHGYRFSSVYAVFPAASSASTCPTAKRMPRTIGLPPQIFRLTTIRLSNPVSWATPHFRCDCRAADKSDWRSIPAPAPVQSKSLKLPAVSRVQSRPAIPAVSPAESHGSGRSMRCIRCAARPDLRINPAHHSLGTGLEAVSAPDSHSQPQRAQVISGPGCPAGQKLPTTRRAA